MKIFFPDFSFKTILTQAIGFAAMALIFLSYQQRKRKNVLIIQIISGLLFTVHFALLGAYTGAAMNILGAARSFVYSNSEKSWAKSPVWLFVFIAVFVGVGIFTWDGIASLLPIAAMVTSSVGLWIKKPPLMRAVTFPSSPMWMAYNILRHSAAGIITEVFVSISMITAIIRYDIIKKDVPGTSDKQHR